MNISATTEEVLSGVRNCGPSDAMGSVEVTDQQPYFVMLVTSSLQDDRLVQSSQTRPGSPEPPSCVRGIFPKEGHLCPPNTLSRIYAMAT